MTGAVRKATPKIAHAEQSALCSHGRFCCCAAQTAAASCLSISSNAVCNSAAFICRASVLSACCPPRTASVRFRSHSGALLYTYILKFRIALRAPLPQAAPGFGPPAVPSGVELRLSGCRFDEPDHRQKNYCPNDGVDNFRADAADENKPNPRQEPAGNEGANNADHDVADEPEAVALHD